MKPLLTILAATLFLCAPAQARTPTLTMRQARAVAQWYSDDGLDPGARAVVGHCSRGARTEVLCEVSYRNLPFGSIDNGPGTPARALSGWSAHDSLLIDRHGHWYTFDSDLAGRSRVRVARVGR